LAPRTICKHEHIETSLNGVWLVDDNVDGDVPATVDIPTVFSVDLKR